MQNLPQCLMYQYYDKKQQNQGKDKSQLSTQGKNFIHITTQNNRKNRNCHNEVYKKIDQTWL